MGISGISLREKISTSGWRQRQAAASAAASSLPSSRRPSARPPSASGATESQAAARAAASLSSKRAIDAAASQFTSGNSIPTMPGSEPRSAARGRSRFQLSCRKARATPRPSASRQACSPWGGSASACSFQSRDAAMAKSNN